MESIEPLQKLPARSPVIVYRRNSRTLKRSYTLIQIEGETIVVRTGRGREMLRSPGVRQVVDPKEIV